MENGTPQQPAQQNVEVNIMFNAVAGMVGVTPVKVNGLAVVHPITCPIGFDTWFEITAKILLAQLEVKRQAATQQASKILRSLNG